MLRKITGYFFGESLINSRVICLISMCLSAYFFYDAAYIRKVPSGTAPYGFLFISAMVGNLVGLYLIEKHENKFQLYMGYLGLYSFFIVGFGGVFFGW